ncbi:MAG: HD domain-containing protein [Candidatus Woesearchaeota archaeon]|nr:HD domain-containing protein [Candidatus Woesearchaeota archaeon]
MNNKDIERLKKLAEPYFKNTNPDRWDHTLRVLKIARILQQKEGGNLDIIEAAALLHDAGRGIEQITKEKNLCHAEESSKIAEKILKKLNFNEEKIKKIKHCIEVHRWSKGLKAETTEAQIIKDADRIEATGAVGIARTFDGGSYKKRPFVSDDDFSTLYHIKNKLMKIDETSVGTETAKQIVKKRHEFTKLFVEEFEKEREEIK